MDMLSLAPLTFVAGKAGLAAGTTSTISQANQIDYAINGKAYRKTATTNEATPTTDYATSAAFPALAANQGTVVLLGRDAALNLRAVQGTIQALDVTGAFILSPQFGPLPDNFAPFGYIVLKAGSTLAAPFTFGSSNMSGVTGMTYTMVDLMGVPARPQVS